MGEQKIEFGQIYPLGKKAREGVYVLKFVMKLKQATLLNQITFGKRKTENRTLTFLFRGRRPNRVFIFLTFAVNLEQAIPLYQIRPNLHKIIHNMGINDRPLSMKNS